MRIPLKVAMLESQWTQIDLARRVSISESRLSKIVHAHVDPTPDERRRLAEALGVEEAMLFEVERDGERSVSSPNT